MKEQDKSKTTLHNKTLAAHLPVSLLALFSARVFDHKAFSLADDHYFKDWTSLVNDSCAALHGHEASSRNLPLPICWRHRHPLVQKPQCRCHELWLLARDDCRRTLHEPAVFSLLLKVWCRECTESCSDAEIAVLHCKGWRHSLVIAQPEYNTVPYISRAYISTSRPA